MLIIQVINTASLKQASEVKKPRKRTIDCLLIYLKETSTERHAVILLTWSAPGESFG